MRERPDDQVRTMVQEGLRRTGYDEVALTSLSSADFSGIDNVVSDLVTDQEGTGGVSVSLPSLRVDAFSVGIATEIQMRETSERPALTERESEVLKLMSEGRTAQNIGEELHLSEATVKTHLHNLYEKLEVSDRAAAVATAMRWGLLA